MMDGVGGYIALIIAALLPSFLCLGFFFLDAKTRFKEWGYWKRQVVFGLAFGVVSLLGTPMSLNYSEGILINVRDAAAVTAGLFYGAPAGIIAGFMGGFYRFISVYWGGSGAYTQLACSISTFVSGLFAALVHKFIFQNKKISWFGAFFTGVVAETFHMLMIFLTHMNDADRAYSIVRGLGIPMILLNGAAVLIASITRIIIYKERFIGQRKSIHRQIGLRLFITIWMATVLTTTFTYFVFEQISYKNAYESLSSAIEEVTDTVEMLGDSRILSATKDIASRLDEGASIDKETLLSLAEAHEVSEINYISEHYVIVVSTDEANVGFSMYGEERGNKYQSESFMDGLRAEGTYVQRFNKNEMGVYMKYAGKKLESGGYVQVGYNGEAFRKAIGGELDLAAAYRHAGLSGFIILADENELIFGHYYADHELSAIGLGLEGKDEGAYYKTKLIVRNEAGRMTSTEILYSYRLEEGFYIISAIPMEEVTYNRDLSALITIYTEEIIFSILFMIVYSLIERFIIRNIDKVNGSLIKIAGGDLDAVVDVHGSREFSFLSRDINRTVAVLKGYTEAEKNRVNQELSFAQSIQNSSMPNVFPPFPNRKDVDIYAGMKAAKMVGGDFYDFYFLPDGKLLFLVADVSNKGVPAAMFMMQTKATIKSLAETGIPVEEVMTKANEKLTEGNDASMFVTVWLATLDLTKGILRYVSAGHNPVLLRHENKAYEYLSGKRGFILAGMDGVKYSANEMRLSPGDQLFLYTDGVAEAKNAEDAFYGENRLLEAANAHLKEDPMSLVKSIKSDVDAFVGEAEQFDDITMLSLRMNSYQGNNILHTMVREGVTEEAIDYLEMRLRRNSFSEKTINKVNIITDEIVSNIVKYSGAVYCEVSMSYSPQELSLEYIDDGDPYNPLEEEEPDINAPIGDRRIGGLGLFMVKKMSKGMSYARKGNKNILHVKVDYER
ncbi:MAG: SpoIIE family protein phosphatase [Bacilli bacterium]|nr:SpoIIE family protein phosphatase [Bacilli bacterium]